MKKREDRRDRTWRKAERAYKLRVRERCQQIQDMGGRIRPNVTLYDKWLVSHGYFSKRTVWGCRCTGRCPGNPKFGRGCKHEPGQSRKAIEDRKEGKRQCALWLRATKDQH